MNKDNLQNAKKCNNFSSKTIDAGFIFYEKAFQTYLILLPFDAFFDRYWMQNIDMCIDISLCWNHSIDWLDDIKYNLMDINCQFEKLLFILKIIRKYEMQCKPHFLNNLKR